MKHFKYFVWLLSLTGLALTGCSSEEGDGATALESPSQQRLKDEAFEDDRPRIQIEAVAITEVVRQTNLPPNQLQAHATRDGDHWSVRVIRIPPVPGEHYLLQISDDGEVTEYLEGA